MSDHNEIRRKQMARAKLMGGILLALVALIYGISIAKMAIAG